MSIPMQDRRRVLALGVESGHGVVATLSNTNAGFRIEDRRIEIVRDTGLAEMNGSGGFAPGVAEKASTTLDLSAFLVGSGTSGASGTLMGLLLPACGFVLATSTWSRTFQGSNFVSLSGSDYRDKIVTKGRGFMGNLVFNFEPGMRCGIEGKFVGGYVEDPTDASVLSGMSYQSAEPGIWSPASGIAGDMLTIDSQTIFRPGKLAIDFGNVVSLRENPNAVGGYDGGWLESGASKWTLDPESYTRATYDFFAKQASGAGGTFTASVKLNGGANNTYVFSMSAQVMNAPKPGIRNGKQTEALTLVEVNDSLTIVKS